MKLAKRPEWITRFQSLMGMWIWDRFKEKRFGWMDFPAPNTDLAFNLLDCGGNTRNVVEMIGGWGRVQVQNFYASPDYSLTWEKDPQLFVKQVLVYRTESTPLGWGTDKTFGDLIIPAVSDTLAVHKLSQLDFFPPPPFPAELYGVPVVVTGYCFSGSTVYVQVAGGWYVADDMPVTGLGSWRDRVLNIRADGWPQGVAPPVQGYTRQE